MSASRFAPLGLLAVVVVAAAVLGLRLHQPEAERLPEPEAEFPSEPAEVDLSATAQLARMMHQPRTVHVLVTNHGAAPVRVREVELVTESFTPTGPVAKDVVIPAGLARTLAVTYGEGRCGGQAEPLLAPATARLVLAEPATTVEFALPDQDDELALLLHRECTGQLVAAAVALRFEGWSEGPGGILYGELVVERQGGDDPIALYDVSGNVLFRVAAEPRSPGPPLGALPPGEPRLAVPVVADTNRCDGHAVGEAKQRFLFRAWVSVGANENLPVSVELDQPDHERFETMLRVRCDL